MSQEQHSKETTRVSPQVTLVRKLLDSYAVKGFLSQAKRTPFFQGDISWLLDREFNIIRIQLGYQDVEMTGNDVVDGLKDYCWREVEYGNRDIETLRFETGLLVKPLLLRTKEQSTLRENRQVFEDSADYARRTLDEYIDGLAGKTDVAEEGYRTLRTLFERVEERFGIGAIDVWPTDLLVRTAKATIVTKLISGHKVVPESLDEPLLRVADIRNALRKNIDALTKRGASEEDLTKEMRYIVMGFDPLFLAANIDPFEIISVKEDLLRELEGRSKRKGPIS